MKQFLFFIFFIPLFVFVNAQSNYTEAIQQGDTAFNSGQYKVAINKYFAAEAFDPSKKEIVKEKVNKVFDRIEMLRVEAEKAKKQALVEKNKAEAAKKETDKALKKAEKLIGTFYFYNDRFALAYKDMGVTRAAVTMFSFYFIDKNGDAVDKLGKWEEAGPFKESGFARVKYGFDYILDTFGHRYPSAYDIKNIDSSILALDLSDKRWDSIPDEVLECKPLQVLILNGRQFSRNHMSTLPGKIDRLKNLENLQLSFCEIDSIPPQIGELKNLAILDLSNNKLSNLLTQIGELKNLKTLNLSGNPIPKSELEKIKKLLPKDCNISFE